MGLKPFAKRQKGPDGPLVTTAARWIIRFKFLKSGLNCMWPDVYRRIRSEPEPEPDSVMVAPLLCMLMMCTKLCNLRINCSALLSVI